jgi:hypothetical protein
MSSLTGFWPLNATETGQAFASPNGVVESSRLLVDQHALEQDGLDGSL